MDGTTADPIQPSQHQSSTSPGIVSVEEQVDRTMKGSIEYNFYNARYWKSEKRRKNYGWSSSHQSNKVNQLINKEELKMQVLNDKMERVERRRRGWREFKSW